jgi:hypothetical protein
MVNDQIQALRAIAEQLVSMNSKLAEILAALTAINTPHIIDPRQENPKRRRPNE